MLPSFSPDLSCLYSFQVSSIGLVCTRLLSFSNFSYFRLYRFHRLTHTSELYFLLSPRRCPLSPPPSPSYSTLPPTFLFFANLCAFTFSLTLSRILRPKLVVQFNATDHSNVPHVRSSIVSCDHLCDHLCVLLFIVARYPFAYCQVWYLYVYLIVYSPRVSRVSSIHTRIVLVCTFRVLVLSCTAVVYSLVFSSSVPAIYRVQFASVVSHHLFSTPPAIFSYLITYVYKFTSSPHYRLLPHYSAVYPSLFGTTVSFIVSRHLFPIILGLTFPLSFAYPRSFFYPLSLLYSFIRLPSQVLFTRVIYRRTHSLSCNFYRLFSKVIRLVHLFPCNFSSNSSFYTHHLFSPSHPTPLPISSILPYPLFCPFRWSPRRSALHTIRFFLYLLLRFVNNSVISKLSTCLPCTSAESPSIPVLSLVVSLGPFSQTSLPRYPRAHFPIGVRLSCPLIVFSCPIVLLYSLIKFSVSTSRPSSSMYINLPLSFLGFITFTHRRFTMWNDSLNISKYLTIPIYSMCAQWWYLGAISRIVMIEARDRLGGK